MHTMHAIQFWPGAKHSTNNASSAMSPYLEDFIFLCIKILVTHKQEKEMAHTHDLIEAKISTRTRKERQRKKKNDMVSSVCLFSWCSSK